MRAADYMEAVKKKKNLRTRTINLRGETILASFQNEHPTRTCTAFGTQSQERGHSHKCSHWSLSQFIWVNVSITPGFQFEFRMR